MSTTSTGSPTTGSTTADRQRLRMSRGARGATPGAGRLPSPPRQRRPALAALAVLLIVGGALVAGLLAIRMDSRVAVLAAKGDLEPGQEITAADVRTVQVASEGLRLIPAEAQDQIIGTYAIARIPDGMLIDQRLLETDSPIGNDKSIVSVVLTPALAPERELRPGDLVQVVRASGSTSTEGGARGITQGIVLSISRAKRDQLGGGSAGSANLLVPKGAATAVIDASSANLAGLALLSRGNGTDVPLSAN